jgi:hypothetical protein
MIEAILTMFAGNIQCRQAALITTTHHETLLCCKDNLVETWMQTTSKWSTLARTPAANAVQMGIYSSQHAFRSHGIHSMYSVQNTAMPGPMSFVASHCKSQRSAWKGVVCEIRLLCRKPHRRLLIQAGMHGYAWLIHM